MNNVDDVDLAKSTHERAAARCEFQLTYARSPVRREFGPGWLSGPNIANAYRPGGTSPGEWLDPSDEFMADDPDLVEGDWIAKYAGYAIQEVVHEALEWFRVDGAPWLDPHGRHDDLIYAAVGELIAKLEEIRSEPEQNTGGA